jgi:hypothetical protein
MAEEKKVDESWKNAVQKERGQPEGAGHDHSSSVPPEPDFNFFVTTLAMQATIALGEVPSPMTQKQEIDLKQAKFIIDVLGILQDKTKGNLVDEEAQLLEELLYGLRMSYVNKEKEKK